MTRPSRSWWGWLRRMGEFDPWVRLARSLEKAGGVGVTRIRLGPFVTGIGMLLLALGCGQSDYAGLLPCEGVGEIEAHCGFTNPEDLVMAPGGRELIVSEMGVFMRDTPGELSVFDLDTQSRKPLRVEWDSPAEDWGEAGCARPEPALFSPHGIDLERRPDGRHALFVVNHGGRESVEVFELGGEAGAWVLFWRGCARPPGTPMLNDVTAFPGGGFGVTHMWEKEASALSLALAFVFDLDTGWVWLWDPETGFSKLPNSDATAPNGIASTPDGLFLFVNHYVANRTVRVDRRTGEVVGEVEVQQPGNVTVDEDGQLWIAGHHHFVADTTCAEIEGACPLPFSVVRADGESMEGEVVFRHEGAPMGFATVALAVGDRLFMGSATGDRMISIALPSSRNATGATGG